MTKQEVAQLAKAEQQLVENYVKGKLRGTNSMLRESMRIAYSAGIRDAINMVAKEGYVIEKAPVPQPEPTRDATVHLTMDKIQAAVESAP